MKSLALVGILLASVTAFAQKHVTDVFTFAIVEKTPAHPYFGRGHETGYLVNGVEGDTIYMIRDSLYALDFDTLRGSDIPQIYTVPIGGGSHFYYDLLVENAFEFNWNYLRADKDTPDTLYYGCGDHGYMGGTIVIVDSLPSSVSDRPFSEPVGWSQSLVSPNPLRTSGMISFDVDRAINATVQVVDVLGRVVSEWDAGRVVASGAQLPIERGNLAPGTYFYRVLDRGSNDEAIVNGSFNVQ